MKKLVLIPLVLVLGACASLGLERPSCYESVAISKIAIGEAFKTATKLSNEEVISIGAAEDTLTALDQADSATDSASALCPIDDRAARDYLLVARDLITNATELMEVSDE